MNGRISIDEIDKLLSGCTYEEFLKQKELLKDDGRKNVEALIKKHERRYLKAIKAAEEYEKRCEYEKKLALQGVLLVAGVDEVGRGPLAGPVCCSAVILDRNVPVLGVKDSKKLSPSQREELSQEIKEKAVAWALGSASVQEIDSMNILNATKLAMTRALMKLNPAPQHVLIDAVRLEDIPFPQTAIIKGDDLSVSIGAASIVAKVARDEYMEKISEKYPQYNFVSNKGYGTEEHIKAIREYGPCAIHRKTFIKNFV